MKIISYILSVFGTDMLYKILLGCTHLTGSFLVSIVKYIVYKVGDDTFLRRTGCTGLVVSAAAALSVSIYVSTSTYGDTAATAAAMYHSPVHDSKERNNYLPTLRLVFY